MNEQTVSRPTDFGTTVRTLRKARGFSQRALADQLHVMGIKADVTYISKIENGKTAVLPSIALIRAIAAVLATDPDHLLLLAGKIDAQALQRRIRHLPELGLLLWRLLDPDLTRDHILHLLALLPERRSQQATTTADQHSDC
jgi:transcriptional regulator with XRE-family HTH domain